MSIDLWIVNVSDLLEGGEGNDVIETDIAMTISNGGMQHEYHKKVMFFDGLYFINSMRVKHTWAR